MMECYTALYISPLKSIKLSTIVAEHFSSRELDDHQFQMEFFKNVNAMCLINYYLFRRRLSTTGYFSTFPYL